MLSKFRNAATRLVVQAIKQNSANSAGRFVNKRGCENPNANNISQVIKEYGDHRLYPNFPDLPTPRLNIPQPIRFFETRAENRTGPKTAFVVPSLQRPVRPTPRSLATPTTTPTASRKVAPAPPPIIEQQRPRTKPSPGPPPRFDPTPKKRMITPRYTPKAWHLAMLAWPPFTLDPPDDGVPPMPDVPRVRETMPNLPHLPIPINFNVRTRPVPRVPPNVEPHVDIEIRTPDKRLPTPYYPDRSEPPKKRPAVRRVKGC